MAIGIILLRKTISLYPLVSNVFLQLLMSAVEHIKVYHIVNDTPHMTFMGELPELAVRLLRHLTSGLSQP